jgi:LacI family transcriptional regulator
MNVENIVKASGVSRSTVFRFLRGENVRSGAKTAIISAMDKLGYSNERAVNSQLHLEIEVSTSEEVDGFLGFTQVVNGITHAADQHGA